jgi:hypothetical protein
MWFLPTMIRKTIKKQYETNEKNKQKTGSKKTGKLQLPHEYTKRLGWLFIT